MVTRIAVPSIRLGAVVALALLAALLVQLTSASAYERKDGGTSGKHVAGFERGNGKGAVYTLTNAAGGNQVAVFARAHNGTLTPAGTVDTGGLGTGSGLGSQGALVLSGDVLVAVNAGSDSISLFEIEDGMPELLDVEDSGGDFPISVTIHRNLVYVLNAGAPENITGFRIHDDELEPLPGSTRPLSGSGVAPAQVSFSPRGDLLVVTEKAANNIDTYSVGHNGLADGPTVHPSAGETPFGFEFAKRGTLVVSEAFGGAPDASTVSSYHISKDGGLDAVTESAPTTETAACWVAISKNGRFAYATNTGSSSVTGYRIHHDGSLTILDADGVTGNTGAGSSPIDAAFSRDGRFLFVLSGGTNDITTFRQDADGSLTNLGAVGGLPAGTSGLAAR